MHIVRRGIPAISLRLVIGSVLLEFVLLFVLFEFVLFGLVLFGLVLFTSPALSAQTSSQENVPQKIFAAHTANPTGPPGTYWRMQVPDQPPLPYNPFPELPVYALDLTNHVFLIDDSTVDYPALNQNLALQNAFGQFAGAFSQLNGSENGDGGSALFTTLYSSQDLWLEMTGLTSNRTGYFVIHPPETEVNGVYDLFATTNLTQLVPGLNGTNWQWVLRCAPGQTNLAVNNLTDHECFFRLGRTNDTDGDLLSDAFERLVSHTDPTNADQNTNGIPDGWEWNHFRNLDQTNRGDYDGDGVSNYDEWLAGSDPNTVLFSMVVTNQFVTTNIVQAQLGVARGVPVSQAVLVDSTNFAAAIWTPYTSSNLTMVLPNTEGWHEVWVGLRGRLATSEQTWQWRRLKLDRTPPALIVTDPASTVSQPMIQLLGYSPESLSVISCDLSNAAGVFRDRMILVLDHYYDTNTFEFTTNTFRAFDLNLKTGLNTITVHATDLAGNSTTTNFDFTLVSDAVAPVLQLWWPQDGARLIGGTFTWRGQVDDFTAELRATVVDAGGNTNARAAIVERDGKFWFENLPLAQGASTLTMTAMDHWGNSTTTNITVIKDTVQLTIDPLDESVLNEPTIAVSGTISVGDHTVWVNGVKATLNGDGTWQAQDVPVPAAGTAVIQARAIPNSDNGGNGTGGGGGASATVQNPGNPTSPQQKDKGAEDDKPWQLYLYKDDVNEQKDHRKIRTELYSDPGLTQLTSWSTGEYWWEYEQHWTYDLEAGKKGQGNGRIFYKEHDENSAGAHVDYGNCNSTFVWPFPNIPTGSAFVTACNGTHSYMDVTVIGEHCDVKDPPPVKSDSQNTSSPPYSRGHWDYAPYTRKAECKWKVFTGGKDKPGKALWSMTGSASEILNKRAQRPFTENTQDVDPSQIKIFGKTPVNGVVFKTLPNGQYADVPFEVTGAASDFYAFRPSGIPYYLISRCVCPREDLDRTTVGVGEQVELLWSSSPKGGYYYSQGAGVPITWSTSSGTVSPVNAWPTKFTAPDHKDNATVTATVRDEKCTIDFSVIEPTGVDHADFVEYWSYPSTTSAGAGMHIRPFIGPTSVSFYRVQIMEVGQAASDIRGYFETHPPPSHVGHGADKWITLDCDNHWLCDLSGGCDYDWAKSSDWSPPWSGPNFSGGGYTWEIPAKWRVGTGPEHSMTGWSQIHSLSANGTMTVTKFDNHTVSRTIQNVYSGH